MRLTLKQLKNLKVETVSGAMLGHVVDLVLEIDGQLVAQYVVKSSRLSPKEYLVGREAVVRFESDKMVVDDNVVGEREESVKKQEPSSKQEAMAMRDT